MITAKFKLQFFDRPRVIAAVRDGKRRVLSKLGAFIRTRARSLIRRRKRVSAPGQPPSAHSKDPNASLKKILFAYDADRDSVIVGPVGLNHLVFNGPKPVKGTVPEVLEFGGQVGIPETQRADGSWRRADLRSRRRLAGKPFRIRKATYAARPYMSPALREALPKVPLEFSGSVKAA